MPYGTCETCHRIVWLQNVDAEVKGMAYGKCARCTAPPAAIQTEVAIYLTPEKAAQLIEMMGGTRLSPNGQWSINGKFYWVTSEAVDEALEMLVASVEVI